MYKRQVSTSANFFASLLYLVHVQYRYYESDGWRVTRIIENLDYRLRNYSNIYGIELKKTKSAAI